MVASQIAINAFGGEKVLIATDETAGVHTIAGGGGTVSSVTPGTGTSNLGKAEDAAHTSGDVGVMVLGVRKDTAVGLGADGDYAPPELNARGAIWVAIENGAGAQITSFGGGAQFAEDAAHASADLGTMALTVRQDGDGAPLAGTTGDYQPPVTDAFNLLKIGAFNPADGKPLDFSSPSSNSGIAAAAATTNATSAKASPGTLFQVIGQNDRASTVFLKFYNKASSPTVGTDTPVLRIPLKASLPFNIPFPSGFFFSVGIAFAMTTGAADSDTGALTLNDVVGLNVVYA